MTLNSTNGSGAVERPTPSFSGARGWLNSPPLSAATLHGKIVLVDFWTYTCINSLRNLPYVKAWAEKYRAAGLVVVGVHSPEFSFETERGNVELAVREYRVTYPIAIDSDHAIWASFDNAYWPADYVLDGNGRIRYEHSGEGEYPQTEAAIQEWLRENGSQQLARDAVSVLADGVEAPADFSAERSPETYLGSDRAAGYSDHSASLSLNHWGLSGSWVVGKESARLDAAPGSIAYRFHSRDLHLVLVPPKSGSVRFRVTLDGLRPGADRGVDVGADGLGIIREPRLYQLIRQRDAAVDRTFAIEFLDPGVEAFVFTFG